MFHFAYLPAAFVLTVGVAALLSVSRRATGPLRGSRAVAVGPLVVVVGLLAWQTHGRLDDWEFAAGLSHRLVQSAHAELGDLPAGSTVIAGGLPNTVNGAYVFRQGFPAALRVTYGRSDFEVQTFSPPVVRRLISESDASDRRYFLIYEPSAQILTRGRRILKMRRPIAPSAQDHVWRPAMWAGRLLLIGAVAFWWRRGRSRAGSKGGQV